MTAIDAGHNPPAGAQHPDGQSPERKPEGLLRRGVEVFAENKLALAGVIVIVLFLLFCFVGPLIYHTDQIHTKLSRVTLPPASGAPLGTDGNGYDELGRLMIGGQTSLEVGIAAAVLATFFGTLWGAVSGYLGGWVDAVMMRIVDGMLAIPALFLLLVLATIVPTNKTVLIVVIALVSWLGTARLVRGESLSLRVREYVQAVTVMGGGGTRAVLRHIAPNAVGTIMVNATFQVADAILTVAALGYLGLSIPPPATDWGGMLSTGLQYAAVDYWWLIYPPGLAIVIVVVAFNFIGDAMRDAFEVRLQRR